ncbi:hypothetical protein GCM10022278_35010 [Allohahella marinimesophila]|uniref:Uncharacterized protein n=1 Tax=Allohahella marinimesophila TaxID=1054972 RepID=A0ABP7Q2C0_9GAMM
MWLCETEAQQVAEARISPAAIGVTLRLGAHYIGETQLHVNSRTDQQQGAQAVHQSDIKQAILDDQSRELPEHTETQNNAKPSYRNGVWLIDNVLY